MHQSFVRSNSFGWIPFKTFLNKISERFISTSNNIVKFYWTNFSLFSFFLRNFTFKIIIKEFSSPFCNLQHLSWWFSQYFHKEHNLLVFTFSWENRESSKKLNKNTSKTPHVNCRSIFDPENHFRCPIESTLNISINLFPLKAATTYINNSHSTFVFFF